MICALRATNPLLSSLCPLSLQKNTYYILHFIVDFTRTLNYHKLCFESNRLFEILTHCRGKLSSEGSHWALNLGAVHLIFHPNAVSESTSILVYRWKSSVCSPPRQEHEAIVSNVIELSSHDGQRLQFNTMVTLSLSHSAPELRGYEVVIKRQINKETNEWEDVSGTKDLRCRQGNVVDLWQL